MATTQVRKKFAWVIKNFSSLESEICYSDPVLIGDCKWCLYAYPKGDNVDYFSLFLQVADSESLPDGWKRYVNLRLTIVQQFSEKRSAVKETHRWFNQEMPGWVFRYMLPLAKLHDEKQAFLVNGELMIAADVEVLEVVGTLDVSEEFEEEVSELETCGVLNKAQEVKEIIDVNGFQVLPSQEESVRLIFERHPDISVEFRAKNQHLRKACMNFLLSLIETLCQSLQELTNEDLVEADIALTYVKDAGLKVDWLEEKLEQVKEKKEKEKSSLARLQEMEDSLLTLKQKCSDLDALMEKEESELLETRSHLSFDDVV